MGGERLRTMSYSDKMLRWNVLGLQGGLLSLFTDPIYLSSLAVADKSNTKRLERALYQRIDGFKPPAPFHLNKPLIGKCRDEPNTRKATTGSPISVNWNLADNSVEVLRTSLGLIDVPSAEKQVSRLSKKDMSMLFKKVCEAVGSPVPKGFTYENLKVHCKPHYQAKLALEACSKRTPEKTPCKNKPEEERAELMNRIFGGELSMSPTRASEHTSTSFRPQGDDLSRYDLMERALNEAHSHRQK